MAVEDGARPNVLWMAGTGLSLSPALI